MEPSVEKRMVAILWDKTCEASTSLGFTVLPLHPYSLNLAPSDYGVFDTRHAQRVERYPTKEAIQDAHHEWDCSTGKDWFCEAIRKLPMMTTIYRPRKGIR
jgi:hypothetical protein